MAQHRSMIFGSHRTLVDNLSGSHKNRSVWMRDAESMDQPVHRLSTNDTNCVG